MPPHWRAPLFALGALVLFSALTFDARIGSAAPAEALSRSDGDRGGGAGRLPYWLHMHKGAGTAICELAKRNGLQAPRRNCNMDGDGPRTLHFTAYGEGNANMSCAARAAAYHARNYSFAAVERWLDLPLCPGTFSYGTALRAPIARALSNMRYHGISDAQALHHLNTTTLPTDASRTGPKVSRKPEKVFYGTAAVDNFYVRTLGGRDVFHRPAGALTRRDLEAAKATLERFDVVAVLEDMSWGLHELNAKWGWQDLPEPGDTSCTGKGCRKKVADRSIERGPPSTDTIAALTAANALDLELYEWARATFRGPDQPAAAPAKNAPSSTETTNESFPLVGQPTAAPTKTETNESFPLVLHYLWPDKEFSFDADHQREQSETREMVAAVAALNPSWEVLVWTDAECDALVRRHFPEFYPVWTQLTPQLKKWDAVRPAILYVHGGIYLDHDISCSGNPGLFSSWVAPSPGTRLLVRDPAPQSHNENWRDGATGRKCRIGNHFMGSVPRHPVWLDYLANIRDDIGDGAKPSSVVEHTGPGQLCRTVASYFKRHPGEWASVRLLAVNELENAGECRKYAEKHGQTAGFCDSVACTHEHSASPAEINGEDDNAKKQLLASIRHNEEGTVYTAARCGSKGPCGRFEMYARHTNNSVVFVHVPKAGGTTVERSILGGKKTGGSCHATAAELQACDPARYAAALSIAVLREPVARAVSLFEYAKQGGNGKASDAEKFAWVRSIGFAAFVAGLARQTEYMYAPQSHYVNNADGQLGVRAVLCVERLGADWETLVRPIAPHLAAISEVRYRGTENRTTTAGRFAVASLKALYPDDFALWETHCGGGEVKAKGKAKKRKRTKARGKAKRKNKGGGGFQAG